MVWSNGWENNSKWIDTTKNNPAHTPIEQQSINPTPSNPWDAWSQDRVLLHWKALKDSLAQIKSDEMEFRKYVVSRAFPDAHEGTNTLELGNGWELKAQIKYNYKLLDNDTVEKGLDAIAKIGNSGSFIADRLVHWTPAFQKSEYNNILEDAEKGSGEARAIIKELNNFLVIEDAAPTVDLKENKKKGKK